MTETEDGTAKTKNKKASGDDAEQGKEGLEDGSDPPENMSDWHKGLMDVALLTANVNQLRHAMELKHFYKTLIMVLFSLSIVLQIVASCILLVKIYLFKKRSWSCYDAALGILMIIIILVNIVAAVFGGYKTKIKMDSPSGDNVELAEVSAGERKKEPAPQMEDGTMSDWNIDSKGLMDVALLTANANQLREATELDPPYNYIVMGLFSLSLVLQMVAGILLVMKKKLCKKKDYKKRTCYEAAIGILMIIIILVNVVAAAFANKQTKPKN